MKIGYSAWGFIGDGVIDSPDGGRLTRALFIEHLLQKHEVIWLQLNRDVDDKNQQLFCHKKINDYKGNDQKTTLCNIQYDPRFPELDILFIEWRWAIPGRNCNVDDKNSSSYTPDLERQTELLNHYLPTATKIMIWDKDEKITHFDELYLKRERPHHNLQILSPALHPPTIIFERQTLLFPCDLQKIRGTKVNTNFKYLIGYVGSQYERDEQMYRYIIPCAAQYPDQVIFAGNWMKYKEIGIRNTINFPFVKFVDRIMPKDMWKIYHECLATLLLCKKNYAEHGHITQRIHEAAANGVIAIGLKEQIDINKFILPTNIVNDAYELTLCVEKMRLMTVNQRQEILNQQIEMLEPFDIRNVMKEFEKILDQLEREQK